MNLNIERIEMLLLIAAFVAMLARRFKMPYTVQYLRQTRFVRKPVV